MTAVGRGRVAVVTGASRGIGLALAEAFAAAGVRLGLCARTAPAIAGADVVARAVDVADGAAVDRFAAEIVAKFGRIDAWINNAGVLDPIGKLGDVDPAAFARLLEVNVLGVMRGSRAFVRHVRSRSGGGVLVNVSSGASTHAYAGWSAYCASKAAVDRMTECIALEEQGIGLRAHAVAPGIVDTAMQERIRATTAEEFPEVERFRALKRDDAFSSGGFVARRMLDLVFGANPPRDVVVRFPPEKV